MKRKSPDIRQAGRRPESVLVVVYSRDGYALIMERVMPEGLWQSVTGSLRWDEDPPAAAIRELREETGIEGVPRETGRVRRFEILPELKARYAPGTMFNTEHEFLFEVPEAVPVRLSDEHRRCQWLPLREAAERVFSWTNREALNRISDRANG